MQYRSLAFLIVVFSLCSADLFMFSGASSRPAGVLAIYSLVFEKKQTPSEATIHYAKVESRYSHIPKGRVQHK